VYAANLNFLVQLLGAKFNRLLDALILRLAQRRFEKQQFEQVGIVEVLGVAFEESQRCQLGLLDVQLFGLRKLEQRTQVIRSGGVNDDDTFALFELRDDVVAVNRRKQQHGNGERKPEPRQAVAQDQQTGWVKVLPHGHLGGCGSRGGV